MHLPCHHAWGPKWERGQNLLAFLHDGWNGPLSTRCSRVELSSSINRKQSKRTWQALARALASSSPHGEEGCLREANLQMVLEGSEGNKGDGRFRNRE